MNEHEQRAWAALLDATLPPPIPPADRLLDRVQAALATLQELEDELHRHPELGEFGQQVTDAVSMVGRLQDRLDYPAEEAGDDEEGAYFDHAPG